jgi:SAM-dependent methyltransferase
MSVDARIERERWFHDDRFALDNRHAADKYYDTARSSQALYDTAIRRIEPGQAALEYGCGQGSAAFDLAQRGVGVVGIDISPVAISQAIKRAAKQGISSARFEVMNAEKLEFDDDSFDLVCGSGILHHLDLEAALAEIARVLRPDGHAVFFEPMGHNPLIKLYRRFTPSMRTPDEHPLLMSDFDTARARFGTVDVTFFHALSLAAVPFRKARGGSHLLRALEALDRSLFDHVPASRRLAWVAVLRLGQPQSSRP